LIILIAIAAYWVIGLVSCTLFWFFEVDDDSLLSFLFWPIYLLILLPVHLISRIPTLSQIKARRLEAKKREDDDPLANLIDAL
jgi:hypothetical protein